MDNLFCCSCCGLQNSLYGKRFQEVDLYCSHCGRAVKQWSCHSNRCEVLIWAKARRNYVCTNCTKSEFNVPNDSNNISMLALSLSIELYYKCKRRLISDEEGDMLIELWRKARVAGSDFARAAAKEAAAAAYRASETADFTCSATERIETEARSMMAELARNQARARARASVPAIPPDASSNPGSIHRRPSGVQTSSLNGGQKENATTRSSAVLQHPDTKESTRFSTKNCEQQDMSLNPKSKKRRGTNSSSKKFRPFPCGCQCQ